jgi:hypothetical protein
MPATIAEAFSSVGLGGEHIWLLYCSVLDMDAVLHIRIDDGSRLLPRRTKGADAAPCVEHKLYASGQ